MPTVKAKTKPINRLNKTELMDKFIEGEIPIVAFCDLMDAKGKKGGKKQRP